MTRTSGLRTTLLDCIDDKVGLKTSIPIMSNPLTDTLPVVLKEGCHTEANCPDGRTPQVRPKDAKAFMLNFEDGLYIMLPPIPTRLIVPTFLYVVYETPDGINSVICSIEFPVWL